jgi:hypothetical protein
MKVTIIAPVELRDKFTPIDGVEYVFEDSLETLVAKIKDYQDKLCNLQQESMYLDSMVRVLQREAQPYLERQKRFKGDVKSMAALQRIDKDLQAIMSRLGGINNKVLTEFENNWKYTFQYFQSPKSKLAPGCSNEPTEIKAECNPVLDNVNQPPLILSKGGDA